MIHVRAFSMISSAAAQVPLKEYRSAAAVKQSTRAFIT
jgi:hypothetical protein